MFETLIGYDQELLLLINGANNSFFDGFMWYYSKTATWIPLVIGLLYAIFKNNNWREALLIVASLAVVFVLADQIASGLIKPLVERPRPTHADGVADLVHVVRDYRGGQFGFVSSHASNSFGAAVFCALLFRDKLFAVVMLLWASVNCYSRMYLGVHYPGDILGGIIVGVFAAYVGYGLYVFVRKKLPIPTKEKSYKSDLRYLYVILLLSLVYLCVRGFINN